MIEKKKCSICRTEKLLKDFSSDKYSPDKHRWQCKECCKNTHKIYRLKNREKIRIYYRDWYKNNFEKSKELQHQNYIKNKDNPKFKLNQAMKGAIGRSLRGNKNNQPWESLVGYTINKLKQYIGKKFLPGMLWSNYGEWEIDHKIPISIFNFEFPDDIDFKKCWALVNLQPMWKKENRRKSNRINHPFQPSLRLGAGGQKRGE